MSQPQTQQRVLQHSAPSLLDLKAERAYLLHSLQRQEDRAKRLFASLVEVETKLAAQGATANTGNSGSDSAGGAGQGSRRTARRSLRKEAGLLKSKIAESERQDRLVLSRLSDLYIEIQGRERRTGQNQHFESPQPVSPLTPYSPSGPGWGHGSPIAPPSPLPDGGYFGGSWQLQHCPPPAMIAAPAPPQVLWVPAAHALGSPVSPFFLSPLSPAFVPGVMFSDPFALDRAASNAGTDGSFLRHREAPDQGPSDYESRSPTAAVHSTAHSRPEHVDDDDSRAEAGIERDNDTEETGDERDDEQDDGLPPLYVAVVDHRGGGAEGHRTKSIALHRLHIMAYAPSPRDQRMSLPSLRSIWPEASSELETE